MQATSWPVVILGVAGLLVAIATYVFGFAYAIMNRRRSSRASNYALAGVGVFLLASVSSRIAPIFIASVFGVAQMAIAMTALGLLTTILSMVGIALLLIAVFIDREPRPQSPDEFLPGDQRTSPPDRNPYAASPVDSK